MNATNTTRAGRLSRRFTRSVSIAITLVAGTLLLASPASAAEATPHWKMIVQTAPTEFHPADTADIYEVIAANDGAANTSGSITLTDTLPAGLTVNAMHANGRIGFPYDQVHFSCEQESVGTVTTVTCSGNDNYVPVGATISLDISVSVPAEGLTGPLENTATVSGGGATEAATTSNSTPLTPSSQPVPYGSSIEADITNSEGGLGTQAGSHPFSFTTLLAFSVGSLTTDENKDCFLTAPSLPICFAFTSQSKDSEVSLPPGLVGNPTAIPQCKQSQWERNAAETCPAGTQVGSIEVFFNDSVTQHSPVYNLEPPPGQPAELGFTIAHVAHIPIFFHLRTDGDYGLSADISEISQFIPPRTSVLSIWGFPSDEAHNRLRRSNITPNCGPEGCPSGVENPQPFLTMPTSCEGSSLPISVGGDSWQNPLFPYPVFETSTLAGMTGCNKLKFAPTLEARPTTNRADSPSGLHVDLKVPQDESNPGGGESPQELATANLRDATITLPKGLTVNPSSAAGLQGCTPAQIGLTSKAGEAPMHTNADPAHCPDASKLGTVEIDTQLIDHPLLGAVYLAQPYANPFKSLLALYITVDDPQTSTVVKLAAKVEIGDDGQLTATLTDAPQTPFTDFKLDFFGGAQAPLRTPATCGQYETTSELTPYSAPQSGPSAKPSDPYEISQAPSGAQCPKTAASQPNGPSFEAGTASPLAGAYSPFSLHLHREDGSQNFSALNVNLPPGVIGKLAGVGECPDSALATAAAKTGTAEQADPSCPAQSKVGTVNVGAGAGPSPYNATGTAYLAGPYKGAPLSLAIITPALAGPFDLGTVVVRNALYVNPETAQISVRSDPIPTALQGIQLDVRSIDLSIDRSQFILNPTNCERMAVGGEAISPLGNTAPLTNPFQVGACNALGFKPHLALSLKGATKRTGNPALKVVLSAPTGAYANIARSQVTLPPSELLDNAHIGTVCTRVQFAEGSVPGEKCPPASVYGFARAITPLLDQPVEGPVYLRSSSHELPDLVVALNGQVNVALVGRVDSAKGGGLRNTFEVAPDAPISKFTLSLKGGKKGLLQNSVDICRKPQRATADFTAQNGIASDTRPVVGNSCKHKKHHKRHGHRAAR